MTEAAADPPVVREAREQDARALLRLQHQLDAETSMMMLEEGERTATAEDLRARLGSVRASPNSTILIAEADGQLVGYVEAEGGIYRLAELAGFERVHVECHIDINPGSDVRPVSLDALLDTAPNPHAPTSREAITAALAEPEQERFIAELAQAFVEERAVRRMAVAYLAAAKAT